MAYIGNAAQTAFTSFDKQTITGDGTAVYTLSHSVANDQEVEVFVNNVRQEGGSGKAYTVSGNQITFSENIASTDDCYVVFQGKALQTVVPPAGSVTDSMITGLSSSKLTGALPALSGANLTNLPGGGKLLNLEHASVTARQSITITANVYADTNLTLNITPSAADSKILVIGNFVHGNTGGNLPTYMRVARTLGGTQTAITAKLQHFGYVSNGENNTGSCSCTALDDPQTTSQLTYTAQISRVSNGTAHFNGNYYQTGFESFLTAIEIGA